MNELTIAPNRPLTLALVDPEGHFDFETGMGQYQTTTGELVTLPRPAVVILNTLDPQPGEQIVICKHWSGRPGEKAEWTISLSPKSENTRAEAEKAPSDLTGQLERSIEAVQARKAAVELPTPIYRPARSRSTPEVQPRLFDRGTGTYGPAPAAVPLSIPLPAVAIGRAPKVGQIPANVATRENSGIYSVRSEHRDHSHERQIHEATQLTLDSRAHDTRVRQKPPMRIYSPPESARSQPRRKAGQTETNCNPAPTKGKTGDIYRNETAHPFRHGTHGGNRLKTATELAAAASIFARWAADMKPTDSDPYAQARKLIQYHLLAAANKAREIAESMENAPREAKP